MKLHKLESTKILEENNILYALLELDDRAVSVSDVVKYSKGRIKEEEICKTIILKDGKGEKYAFFLKGKDKISFSKAKEIVGEKLSVASFEEVKEATGAEPGAVCPVTLKIPFYTDKKVFWSEKINFGSGNHLYGLEINSKDLKKAINCKEADFTQQ